jgi:hypothetical protein
MKGEIKVESEEGKGTAFTVSIPLTAEANSLSFLSSNSDSSNDFIPCCKHPVLIFETDHRKIQFQSQAFNNLGCDVKVFSCIEKSLDFIAVSKLTAIFLEVNLDNQKQIATFLQNLSNAEKKYPFPAHIPIILLISKPKKSELNYQ